MKAKKEPNKKMLKIGTYTILIILIISFIGVPIISLRNPRKNTLAFGSYNGKEIIFKQDNYFGLSVNSAVNRYKQQSGTNDLNRFLLQFAWKNAFDQTVNHFALLQLAKKSGFHPSKNKIDESIIEIPYLQTDGAFDITLYNQLSSTEKKNLTELQEEINTSEPVYTDLVNLVSMSEREKAFLNAMENDKKKFQYTQFTRNEIDDIEFLKKYAEKNKKEFIKIAFKSITTETEKQLKTIITDLQAKNISFEEAAKAYSTDSAKAQEGDRSSLFAYQIAQQEGDDALKAIRALSSIDELTVPIKTQQGAFAVYALTQLPIEPRFDEEEFQNAAKNYMLAQDPGILENKKIEKAKKFIEHAKTTSIARAAEVYNTEIGVTNAFPINVKNSSILTKIESTEGPGIGQLASENDVLAELFSLKTNEYSKPYVIGNYVYVFKSMAHESEKNVSISDEKFRNFMKESRNTILRKIIVDDAKLQDSFYEAFNKIYPPEKPKTSEKSNAN